MLTAEERADLEKTLRDPERFHSDGREILQACVMVPIFCVGGLAVLYRDARTGWEGVRSGEYRVGFGLLSHAPELFGFLVLIAIAAACIAYGMRTYRRHGVAVTSFGVARVRGGVKRLIRYSEIASVTFGERRHPAHQVITDELEVKARDGRVIMLYGFGIGRWKKLIESKMASRNFPEGRASNEP